jgi:phosphorylcholine metabolism protein LicD
MKCNKSRGGCRNGINYKGRDYILKKCCRNCLMDMLDQIPYIMSHMDWWLEFGTLLGLIREGKIIDWDDDIDIGINEESMTLENIQEMRKKCEEFGFILGEERINEKNELDGFRKIYYSDANRLYCDIWTFKRGDNNIRYAPSTFTAAQHEDYFTKNKKIFKFNNKEYFIPDNVEEFLQIRYANWRKPIKGCRSYRDGREHVKDFVYYPPDSLGVTILENPPKNKY